MTINETFIHGNNHYKPGIKAGVKYLLARDDPNEPEDVNCIRVLSIPDRKVVGNICRGQAIDLAARMDASQGTFYVMREGRPPSNIYRVRVSLTYDL